MTGKLERYLTKAADDLPAMPMIASQVVKAVDDPNASIDDIRKLIQQDAAIAARLLKMANSSLYGFPSEIQSLGHAISLLGTLTVKNLVLAVSMKQTYKRFGLMEKLLWQHSSLAGPVAGKLAKLPEIDLDADEAFTAGLLHHVGKTALANSHRDEYEGVIQRVYNEKVDFVEAEREKFGFDHTELGAAVAGRWKLPPRLVEVIRCHHDVEGLASMPEETGRLCALITVTSNALTKLGVGRRAPVDEIDMGALHAWSFLGLAEDDVEPTLQLCQEQVKLSEALIR